MPRTSEALSVAGGLLVGERSRRLILALDRPLHRRTLLALTLVVLTSAWPAAAQTGLPDVDVAIVLDVRDTGTWLALYDEVLSNSRESSRPLGLSLTGSTGTNRYLTINVPKFKVTLIAGSPVFRVVIGGKVGGVEALRGLAPFERAILEAQPSPVAQDEVTLTYGLSSVGAHIVELDIARQ
jgi:hypothetical protein